MRERENPCRNSQLVGPGFRGALVSEKTASRRPVGLVRAAFRFGRGKLDVLFRAGTENGGAMVRCNTGWFQVRRKIAPAVFVSLHASEVVAARFTKPRGDRREREGESDARRAGGPAKNFPARDRNVSQCRKNGRAASATVARVFAAETRLERAGAAYPDAGWVRAGD